MRRLKLARDAAWALSCMLAFASSACIKERPALRGSLTTLVLLNYQVDYLRPGGRMPVGQDQVDGMIRATNRMIAAMGPRPLPVIYTLNEFSPFQPLTDMAQNFSGLRFASGSVLDRRIHFLGGVYFTNQHWDAFANSQFERHLQLIGAGQLVLAGTYPERAALETTRAAKRRGYPVIVITDAVASSDSRTRDAALQQLKKAGAELETSDQFVASLR